MLLGALLHNEAHVCRVVCIGVAAIAVSDSYVGSNVSLGVFFVKFDVRPIHFRLLHFSKCGLKQFANIIEIATSDLGIRSGETKNPVCTGILKGYGQLVQHLRCSVCRHFRLILVFKGYEYHYQIGDQKDANPQGDH